MEEVEATKVLRYGTGLLAFLAGIVGLVEALRAWRLVRSLPEGDGASTVPPTLSVVIPARDEEEKLEGALRTVLGQDYPGLEVILVDDRSTDGTAGIMARLARGRDRVAVIRVEELPEGWLGKNHAIHVGARAARGDRLLFTDADVLFAPGALRGAVAHAEGRGLDHLTLVPELRLRGYWLRSFVAFFYTAFLVIRGYYKANLLSSKTGVGIGAFNLVRRTAYEKVGGYAAFPNRPDDDLTLGQRIKALGLRQELSLGHGLVAVEWYASLGELLRGVEKNAFAALDYDAPKTAGYVAAFPLVAVLPFWGALFYSGKARALHAGAATAQLASYAICNRFLGPRVLPLALGYPACALVFSYALARSALLALARGGIYWRGTFYPLSLLEQEKDKRKGQHESYGA